MSQTLLTIIASGTHSTILTIDHSKAFQDFLAMLSLPPRTSTLRSERLVAIAPFDP
jgi:hypothetical protein